MVAMNLAGNLLMFVLVLCNIGLVYTGITFIRNRLVYKIRTRMLKEDYTAYKKLPDYDKMVFVMFHKWTYDQFYKLAKGK